MVTGKIRNPEKLKKILKGNRITLASSMMIISEFILSSFSEQVKARGAKVIRLFFYFS